MRRSLRRLLLAVAASLAACTNATDVRPDQDALAAAAQFQSLADDAFRAGADPDVGTAYRDIGITVSRNGRISPVTIVVDGTPLDFLATAQQLETEGGPACGAPGALCPALPPLRSVVAWQKSDPRRVVQLSAVAGSTGLGPAAIGPAPGGLLNIASLIYFDGTGGVYVATGGTQQIGDAVASDTPCSSTRLPPGAVSAPELARCTRAELTASFDGTVAPPAFLVRGNTAAGTHTIAMASQPVHGTRLVLSSLLVGCPGCDGYPLTVLPPVNLRGGALRATLTATAAASLVTLELRVTNPQIEPVTIQFSSGQQYDFRVRRIDGATIWVWSADKLFTAALGSRTLAAGETVVFTGTWTPSERGSFVVEGRLTSTSHQAGAAVTLAVP